MTENLQKPMWPKMTEAANDKPAEAAKPSEAVATAPVDYVASFLRAGDRIIDELRNKMLKAESAYRETVSNLELEHHRKMRDLEIGYEKEVAAIRAEIAVMSSRLGFTSGA